MRPWRLVIEYGDQQPREVGPAAVSPRPDQHNHNTTTVVEVAAPPLHRDELWQQLLEARAGLKKQMETGTSFDVDRINLWIGGALAALATLTGEDVTELNAKLQAEAPVGEPGPVNTSNGRVTFVETKRERPKPPPGAPRDLDPHDLSEEERADLGIVLEDEEEEVGAEEASTSEERSLRSTD